VALFGLVASPCVWALEIFEIQGSGLESPVVGQIATTTNNTVTAVGPEGFFIQTPSNRSDGDPQTSDGVYVYLGGPASVEAGDRIDVTGEVVEYYGFTEIGGDPSVIRRAQGAELPPAVVLDGETPSPLQPWQETELERLEGMRVALDAGLVCGPTDRWGDAVVAAGSARAFREPGIHWPGISGLPVFDGNPELFELDPDALVIADVELAAGTRFRAEGVIGFAFGDYQLWPTSLEILATPPTMRDVAPRAEGQIAIATQNLRRLFDDQDDGQGEQVESAAHYQARCTKMATWIRTTLAAPDVLAVQEAEHLGVLQDVADCIADNDPSIIYTAHLEAGGDPSGLDVGFLVRDSVEVLSLRQIGADAVLNADGNRLHDRPPLVLEAAAVIGSHRLVFTVVAVHLRSLNDIEDPERGSWVRRKRHEQAVWIARWLDERQRVRPHEPLLVAGDLNAFEFSDGYVNVVGQITGRAEPDSALLPPEAIVESKLRNRSLDLPPAERYTFVHQGNAEMLDHILTNRVAGVRVRATACARGNADAADGRAIADSDHDGLVVVLGRPAVRRPAGRATNRTTAPAGG